MKIVAISISRLIIPLIRPFITAVRRTENVEDIVVMIKTDCGKVGYGSGAATPMITGDTQESMVAAIRDRIAPQLIGKNLEHFNELLHLTDTALQKNTSAKAAIDIALHDLFAQKCQLPLYQFLGGHKNTLDSCLTISLKNKDEMVNDAQAFVRQGFCSLKIKLGSNPNEDMARVRAIRAAVGPQVELAVDANQGWDVKSALRIIRVFEQENLNIHMIEQPVVAHDLKNLKYLCDHVSSFIMADESCFSPMDALHIAQNNSSDGINIKLMKSGGIYNANAMYHIATAANIRVMVGCMLESPIGVAAIASFAASKPDILLADLDPMMLIRQNPVLGGVQLINNQIVLSDKPGLGIEGFRDELVKISEIT